VPAELREEYLADMGRGPFAKNRYNLMHHNCNNFSQSYGGEFLTGSAIPVQPRCRVTASLAVSAHTALPRLCCQHFSGRARSGSAICLSGKRVMYAYTRACAVLSCVCMLTTCAASRS